MPDAPIVAWTVAGATLLLAAILVLALRYDLRLDRAMARETYWRFPALNRLLSILRLALRYALVALGLAMAVALVWAARGTRLGLPAMPGLGAAVTVREAAAALWRTSPFWLGAGSLVLLQALIDVRRCLRAPMWDLFVSYKSEDVAWARAAADHLISVGMRVWFAEYQVLLQNYEHFQKAIDRGLRNCRAAIVFTNDRYTRSPYCRQEVEALLKRLDRDQILEVMVPRESLPHRDYSALAAGPHYEAGDVAGLLDFLERAVGRSGLPGPYRAAAGPVRRVEGVCLGRAFSLDATGWVVESEGQEDRVGSTQGMELRWADKDRPLLHANLYVGREHSYQGQRASQSRDDRQMFLELFATARTHVAALHTKLRGLHLVFHSGLSQMALTYPVAGLYWTRKYSIIIPHSVTGESAEFVFTFGLAGRFADYCRAVPAMDRLVASLDWGGPPSVGATGRSPRPADHPSPQPADHPSPRPADHPSPQPADQRAPAAPGDRPPQQPADRSRAVELTNRAFALVEERDLEQAVTLLQQAIAADPGYGHAYNELAFVYGRALGQLDLAEGYARRAVECEPDNAKFQNAVHGILMARVRSLRTQKAIRRAMEGHLREIDEAIARDPGYAGSHLARAMALALSGAPQTEWQAALRAAEQIYLASGRSAAGQSLDAEGARRIVARSRQECDAAAAHWVSVPRW